MKKDFNKLPAICRKKARRPFTTIYLVRHCHPNYLLKDKLGDAAMPLSKTGVKQADFLAKAVAGLCPQVVFSSALARSIQTAEIFSRTSGKKFKIREDLNEFDWTHWYRVKYFTVSPENRGKNIKAKALLNRRLNKFMDISRDAIADIVKDNRGRNIVLFTHGNFIKSILCGILDSDIFGFLSLEIFQSSITKIMIDRDNNVIISYINDVNHLPQKPVEDAFLTLSKK